MKLNGIDSPIELWAGDIPQNNVSDGAINLTDIMMVAASFNSSSGDLKYVEAYDLNADGSINLSDIMIIANHFNKTKSDYPKCELPRPAAKPESTQNTLATIRGTLSWTDAGLKGYMVDGYYLGTDGLPGMDKILGSAVEVRGYIPNYIPVGQPENVIIITPISYTQLYVTTSATTPTIEPTPASVTFKGKVVWNSFEGGFYGVVCDGASYDIGNGLPDMKIKAGDLIEITGYPHPDWVTIHMWGIPFELISYKLLNES